MPVDKECLDIFKRNSDSEIQLYLDKLQYHQKFDVFIYINNEARKCILCSAKNDIEEAFKSLYADLSEDDPFQIEKLLFVWSYGLQDTTGDIEDQVEIKFLLFKDLEQNVAKLYYIGRYENTGPKMFDLAALKAIPDHSGNYEGNYESDFVVRFCEFLISFSDIHKNNERQEEIVQNIEKVKQKLFDGASPRNQLLARVSSIFKATVRPSDVISGPGLIILFTIVVICHLFVAVIMTYWWSTKDN